MSNQERQSGPWEEPMDEFLEHNIRDAIGRVQQVIRGLLQYLEGYEEWLPSNYEFFTKHPDFAEAFQDKTIEELIQALKSRRESLQPALQALEELDSEEMIAVYKIASQPGFGKMVMGLANIILFLKQVQK